MFARTIPCLVMLTVAACSQATSPRDVSPGSTVSLEVGHSANIHDSPVVVRFTGLNDSRCPSNVQCVQAGDAQVIVDFAGAGADRRDTLYLVRQPKSSTYGPFRFDALDVQPYPVTPAQGTAKVLTIRVSLGS